ncbi:Alpha/beta hydrolase fold [Richelia intracellularis]|nr:Alpha/beta hydrolase fold [Richelia intracellularis]
MPEIEAELLQDKLNGIKVPTLVLQAGKDDDNTLHRSRIYADLIPTARYKMIAHGDERFLESCAAVVAGDIQDFIQQFNLYGY